ncbi:MAG: peptide ABC transporter ATP-binding protein [Rhodobacteraceae bacterium]|jgi:oligopeptide/dipeptide ABC transporter ATP-binding protein|uniref:Peptide/nickel transport system ATP-binding protein n=1 Tax=Salipiger profundus TaxID=1229727 RepID=A0A1U7D7K7_9RHOB|nr:MULTISPECIES: oligopeptide/dipeptide ABC transporter ATP-binding protein [Salipiger]APX24141.1 peptide/nickel transport system ATP-binding protein [Salipiger profundus]MAB06927.1 peptide ABC transporter ATP-binding protein [Paracoccaceae bacterium]GFZ94919.1 ABC transporter ATP-binding protein [Salipiger profundus]SFB89940.1 peptide/nickel transport system ATP-binding protein/oligopeptide transport system ATP-binding protein [Salipiger profundus]
MSEQTDTTQPLVVADHLGRNYPMRQGLLGRQHDIWAVRDVSLTIARGETVGIVGESGCGKSTLGRMMMGLESPTTGTMTFEGRDLTGLSSAERRKLSQRMQMVFQDPFGSLDPRRSIGAQIADGLRTHNIVPTSEVKAEVARLLEQVGLPASAAQRRPHEFSGGQRQRIAVARALSTKPDFIVADEPVSALDVSIQAQVVNLLMDLRRDLDLAMLFISHDLHVVRHLCTRIAVMYLGRVVEEGPAEKVFGTPAHPYTRALLAATPSLHPKDPEDSSRVLPGELPSPANPPSGCPFRTRCPIAEEACASAVPPLDPVGDNWRAACIKAGPLTREAAA